MYNPLTLKQVQEDIKKSYFYIKLDLAKDVSEAAISLKNDLNSWVELEDPDWNSIIILRDDILQYQEQLGSNIRLHIIADYLLLKLDSVISDNLIGYTDIFKNFPNNNCLVKSSSNALSSMKEKISLLNGDDLDFYNIAISIAEGSCAQYNEELIKSIEMDLHSWGNSENSFQQSFPSIIGETSGNIVNNIYSLLDFSSAGQIDSLIALADAIKQYKQDNPEEQYSNIASDMNNILQGLTSSLYQNVASNISNVIAGNEEIVNGLELFLSNQYPANYLSGSSLIKKVQGNDPYAIAASFYLNPYINYPLVKSMADAMAQLKNSNPTSEIVSVIQNSLAPLSATVTTNQLAQTFLTALNSSNQELMNELILSLDNIIYRKNIFASDIIIKLQDSFGPGKDVNNAYDDPYLIAQALDNILSYGDGANIVDRAQKVLASLIDQYHFDNNVDYSIIVSSLYNNLNTQILNNQDDFNLMSKSVAAVINQESNNYLVGIMEYDMTNIYLSSINGQSILYPYVQASSIMARMDSRTDMLYDGASISASYYAQIYANIDQKRLLSKGADLLIASIENGISNSKTHDSITALYGDIYVNAWGSGKFFNKCAINNEGSYVVTESVFNGYGESITGELSDFQGLNSVTGMLRALAQCGSWILTIENQDLLISTSKPIGTTGSITDTECSLPLEPGIAMGVCESLFDATPR